MKALIVEEDYASVQSNGYFDVLPQLPSLESIHLRKLADTNRQLPQVFSVFELRIFQLLTSEGPDETQWNAFLTDAVDQEGIEIFLVMII